MVRYSPIPLATGDRLLLYGMTTGSLKFRLNKTSEEADEITSLYWGTFPRVQPWLQETVRFMKRHKRIRYWSGRIWREEEEDNMYKACNAQIQGGAADMIKLAVMRAQTVCTHQGWGNVAFIVHDEIICEIKDEYLAEAAPVLIKIMELEDVHGLPFKAEAKIGKSYGDVENKFEIPVPENLDWRTYLPPGTDMERLTLRPWKELHKERWET